MEQHRIDRWLGVALAAVALIWLWLVRTQIPDIRTEGEPGPQGFPFLLGIVLAVLGTTLAVRGMVAKRDPDATTTIPPIARREAAFAVGTFALLILYAFLLDTLGFLLATPVVMALAMEGLLRMRRWVRAASLAVGFTIGCWVIFDLLLGTPLPRGTWLQWL